MQDHLVESIDLVPTFVESAGGLLSVRHLEGRSLLPLLHDSNPTLPWRDFAISEIDFGSRGPRQRLEMHPYDCRAWIIRTPAWKYVLHQKFRPQLFNLADDPDEIIDLGPDPSLSHIREQLHEQLFGWQRTLKVRTETAVDELMARGPQRNEEDFGVLIGHW